MQMRMRNSKWLVPGFAVGMGLLFLAAGWANGDPGSGLVSLGIMVAFAAALVLLSGRSGVVEVMRNPHTDERASSLDLRATAFAGLAVITAILVAFFYELARGHDPSPYAQLGALGGVAYLVALIVLQRRS
jgi:hypothetical protein